MLSPYALQSSSIPTLPEGVELISYQRLIRESERKFTGMAWYAYDVEFRRRASHNLLKKWGERDVQLYLDTFAGLPKSSFVSPVELMITLQMHVPFLTGPRTLPAQTILTCATI